MKSFVKYIYPCVLQICSDGEVLKIPGKEIDPALQRFLGKHDYREGSFQPLLRAMLEESPPEWQPALTDFIITMGMALAADVFNNNAFVSSMRPSVHLVKNTLFFDSDQHSIELPALTRPRYVVDYGPGIAARFMIQDHIEALQEGRPFVYVPVTRGAFISVYMATLASWMMTPESFKVYSTDGFIQIQEAGMLAVSEALVSNSPGAIDLILCSGLQLVEKNALRAGIRNAFPALAPGGILFLRSQRIRDPESSSTVDDMLEIAYEAGFSPKTARYFHSISGGAKQMPTLSAVLTKN